MECDNARSGGGFCVRKYQWPFDNCPRIWWNFYSTETKIWATNGIISALQLSMGLSGKVVSIIFLIYGESEVSLTFAVARFSLSAFSSSRRTLWWSNHSNRFFLKQYAARVLSFWGPNPKTRYTVEQELRLFLLVQVEIFNSNSFEVRRSFAGNIVSEKRLVLHIHNSVLQKDCWHGHLTFVIKTFCMPNDSTLNSHQNSMRRHVQVVTELAFSSMQRQPKGIQF